MYEMKVSTEKELEEVQEIWMETRKKYRNGQR